MGAPVGLGRSSGLPSGAPIYRGAPSGGRIDALGSTTAPAGLVQAGAEDGVEQLLPGELELGRRAGRSEDRGRGGEAEVLEDPAHDGSVGEERDELALPAAPWTGEHVDLEDALQELGPGGALLRAVTPRLRL
jgi:hypothetical protein